MARPSLVARLRRRLRRSSRSPRPSSAPPFVQPPSPSSSEPTAEHADMVPVTRLGDALWAGLTADAAPELERLATDGEPAVAVAAAYELASWAFMHGDKATARAWAQRLDPLAPDQAVVAALVALQVHDGERAAAILDAALGAHPEDPHLVLHRANLLPVGRRLEAIDGLLVRAGCQPICSTRPIETFGDLPVEPSLRAPHPPVDEATSPLVTVVVPAFRAAHTIAHAIGSLQAQTYPHLQIIVVDDASDDDTADIVREAARGDSRISLVRQGVNGGAYAARNAGLDRATGAFVTVHDADDWAHPQRIERQVRHLLAHPDLVANATHLVRMNPQLQVQAHGRHPYKVVGKNTASLMVRRQIFSVVGAWDAGVRGGADFELVKRLEARFGAPAIAHLLRHAPLTLSLRHDASLTSATTTGMASLWHVYGARRQYLDGFTAWHRSDRFAGDLPWTSVAVRPFPAPLLLSGGSSAGFVDVVVQGDLSPGASGVSDAVAHVVRAAGAGRSLALWHVPHDLDGLWSGLDTAIVRLLADRRARLLSAGEQVRCQSLFTVGPPSTLGAVEGAPQVTVVPG